MVRKLEKQTVENNVFMKNELNIVVAREIGKLKKLLSPYMGKKAFKADGEPIKKLADQIKFDRDAQVPPLMEGGFTRVHYLYLEPVYNSVYLKVGLCFNGTTDNGKSYCEYRSDGFWVADGEDGILTGIVKGFNLIHIDPETEWNNYSEAFDLVEQGKELASKLMPIHCKKV